MTKAYAEDNIQELIDEIMAQAGRLMAMKRGAQEWAPVITTDGRLDQFYYIGVKQERYGDWFGACYEVPEARFHNLTEDDFERLAAELVPLAEKLSAVCDIAPIKLYPDED